MISGLCFLENKDFGFLVMNNYILKDIFVIKKTSVMISPDY